MKKILLTFLLAIGVNALVSAQCTPTDEYPTAIYPDTTINFVSGCADEFYEQYVFIVVPYDTVVDTTIFQIPMTLYPVFNFIRIDSVVGLPAGLTIETNPADGVFLGDSQGCGAITGTTSEVGTHELTFYLTADLTADLGIPFGSQHISQEQVLTGYRIIIEECEVTPVINTCIADLTLNLPASGCEIALPDYTTNAQLDITDEDNQPITGLVVTQSPAAGTDLGVGVHTVEITATSADNISATCEFTVTVVDDISPVVSVVIDGTFCDDETVTWTVNTSDNCAVDVVSSDYESGDVFPVGTTEVTYTVTDVNGNETIFAFDVIVIECTPEDALPVFNACIDDLTLESDTESCTVTMGNYKTNPQLDITDEDGNELPALVIAQSPPVGTTLGVGTHLATIVATNGSKTAYCQFAITVEDNIAPTVEIDIAASFCETETVEWEEVITDNCDIDEVVSTHESGDYFSVGTTTVTYTVTDVNGNETSYEFDVVVEDCEVAPVFNTCIADQTLETPETGCEVEMPDYTADSQLDITDEDGNELTDLVVTQSPAAGTMIGTGEMTVIIFATNGAIMDTCQFTLTVEDNIAPVVEVDIAESFCHDETVEWEMTMTDNCGVDLIVNDYASGDDFPIGTTTVTYTVTDASGNETTFQFDVVVEDCEDTSGLNEHAGIGTFSIYPNPTQGDVTLSNLRGNNKEIYIYNSEGKLISTTSTLDNEVTFSTSSMSTGVYFVKVIQEGTLEVKKLIVD